MAAEPVTADPVTAGAGSTGGVAGEVPSAMAAGPPRAGWASSGLAGLRAVALPWLAARVVVVGVLLLARFTVGKVHPASAATLARVHQGLLGWDAGWYEAIARFGYGPLGHQSLRFFPLFPLAARGLALLPGVSDGVAVVAIANLCALAGTALLWLLVVRETGDRRWADRTVWLFSLAPPAYVLVMGYAEGPLLVCTVGCLLAVRASPRPHWGWAAALGVAAGLTRPLGVVLVLPVAVEAVRRWRTAAGWRPRAASVAAVAAPPAGAGAFLAWSAVATGDGLLPVQVQQQARHHGALSDPFQVLAHDVLGFVHHHVGTALHVPWVVLAGVLVAVCWRRLPASYTVLAGGVLLVALSGTNLDSFERYALSAFPLTIAGASLLANPRTERAVLTLAAAGMGAYALLAFFNLVVP